MKHVLVLYTLAGGGHLAAAKAISEICVDAGIKAVLEDPFAGVLDKPYKHIQSKGRLAWNAGYYLSDNPLSAWFAQRAIYKRYKKVFQSLAKQSFDAVIVTQAMLARPLYWALQEQSKSIPIYIFVTDPVTVHALWYAPAPMRYLVPFEETKQELMNRGVKEHRVNVVGWPVGKPFRVESLKPETSHPFTCIVVGGANGVGMKTMMQHLSSVKDLHSILICGRNTKLCTYFSKKFQKDSHIRVHGFREDMAVLMKESDIVIGKAGTAILCEAFSLGRPVIVTAKVLQQEKGNVELIKKHQLGWVVHNSKEIQEVMEQIKKNPVLLQERKQSVQQFWNTYQDRWIDFIKHL